MTQNSRPSLIDSFLGCLRGCFGFYKSMCAPIGDEEHYHSTKIDDQAAQKPLLYDSFLSSSTYDIEHNYFNINSNSLQNLEKTITSSVQQDEGSSDDSHEFRNHGLMFWNETRKQWLGPRSKKHRRKSQEINNPRISWNATYENLLGSNRRFQQPIPLAEMVDFLVDVWEQEGLYDNTTFGIL
ncbi:zinc finger protein [Rhynchospora pubera]|uniref:Zinc finger protein n=2 Tax=Rhynchospora pubera TaxID=906938 RepID=A0AAV8CBV3_9POAL|nr:zinc finger protein [Rhynchospora pubera]